MSLIVSSLLAVFKVDATMIDPFYAGNENYGKVPQVDFINNLRDGMEAASLSDLGEGYSWVTCQVGCNQDPPLDVAHKQFEARIAWKLVCKYLLHPLIFSALISRF